MKVSRFSQKCQCSKSSFQPSFKPILWTSRSICFTAITLFLVLSSVVAPDTTTRGRTSSVLSKTISHVKQNTFGMLCQYSVTTEVDRGRPQLQVVAWCGGCAWFRLALRVCSVHMYCNIWSHTCAQQQVTVYLVYIARVSLNSNNI